jgi:hypothetical protein
MFSKFFTIFTNLRCLKFNPSSSYCNALSLNVTPEIDISSTLLELHVTVPDMVECLYILDGRFDQLRIFYITCYSVLRCYLNIEHKVDYFY